MGHLKVTSFNVRGLNVPEKCSWLLADLWKCKTQVAFLQEMHFRNDTVPRLTNRDFPLAHHSPSPVTKSKGVSILIVKSVPWSFGEVCMDALGRFLLLKGKILDVQVPFANIYFHNTDQPQFLRDLISMLLAFSEGLLAFGGDLNLSMYPLLYVSRSSSHLAYSRLKCLKADLQLLHLVDPWRLLYPQEQDYSYFSLVHHTYSRLHYLMITHRDLPRVEFIRIDVISFSDHAPVHLTLQVGPVTLSPPSWRLNEALLQSEDMRAELQTALTGILLP